MLLEINRAEIAQRRMPPLPVVEDLQVLEDLGTYLVTSRPRGLVDQFHSQRREEALRHGIVPAIPTTAHAAHYPIRIESTAVIMAHIAAIGVVD